MAQSEPQLAGFPSAGAIGDDGLGRVNAQRFQPGHQRFFITPSQHLFAGLIIGLVGAYKMLVAASESERGQGR